MRKQVLHPRTAVINQKQKNTSKNCRLEALQWLQHTFPEAFDNRCKIRPLNVGIMKDILAYADKAAEVGISKSKLREAVVLFTRRLDYLACLKARDSRIDLFGNPVTPVSLEEAEAAAVKIKKRVEKSIKNARKMTSDVTEPVRSKTAKSAPVTQISAYSERSQAYAAIPIDTQSPRVASVIVTHKPSRQYDPAVVARLKEKLGLSHKAKSDT